MASHVTTQHTSLMMENQKEKEDVNCNKNVNILKQVVTSLSYMEPVLIDSLGTEGLAVFLQKRNGNIILTKSGFDLLNNVLIQSENLDPVNNFLLKCSEQLSCKVGDGIKRFIFYINAFIKLLSNCDKDDVCKILKQLKILQSVINLAENNYLCSNDNDNYDILKFDYIKLKNIIRSFLITRFTLPVSDLFSKLIYDWIMSYHEHLNYNSVNKNIIKMLLSNMNVLCVKHSEQLPLSDSKIQSGFVIKGKINGASNSIKNIKQHPCILKIFLYNDENLNELKHVDALESDIIRLIIQTNIDNSKKNLPQILFITNITLSETLLFHLQLRNIISVQGVLIDDIVFLNDYMLKSYFSKEFVTNFKYYNNNSVWISIPDVSQLILCSPTTDLGMQLKDSLVNLLTLINVSLNNKYNNNYYTLYDINGNFELFLYNILLSNCKKSTNNKPPVFISNRNELLEWHKIKNSNGKELFNNTQIIKKINEKSPLLNGDNTEKLLSTLVDFTRYFSEIIVAQGELCNDDRFLVFFCDVLYYVVRIIKPKESESSCHLELISIKLTILSYVIDVILNICSTDSIHRVRNCQF
ncbi:uncharacterized protein LOC142326686 isoform X1 [Lycorma delicatula]|uniref:uncharacterized protein LOC142326686 isoform X1 n=1 Tax=Lycorma delicatula TaxID=130591 RepID=UPI003F51277E